MRRLVAVLGILAIVVTSANLHAAEKRPADQPEYTGAQIRKMVREAHTIEQYTVLADYYATQQRTYKRKAAEEMHLWALRSEMVNPLSEKWPRPVDSSRNRYEYYEYEASRAATLCAKYNRLADALAAK